MRLPPRDLPPTRLAPREQTSALLRTNAKLFYERRHEASGELDAALAQLASFGLVVTERRPISHYVEVNDARKAAARLAEIAHANAEFEDGFVRPLLASKDTVVEYRPVYFGDRVILRLNA